MATTIKVTADVFTALLNAGLLVANPPTPADGTTWTTYGYDIDNKWIQVTLKGGAEVRAVRRPKLVPEWEHDDASRPDLQD